jgi:AcrR family transcriptional regulator
MMMLTKDELTAAIVASAGKLGYVPSRADLAKQTGVSPRNIRKHFGTYERALEACGLERSGSGKKVRMLALFQDWTEIARRLKKVPTVVEYEHLSRYSVRPLQRIFGAWTNVPDGMKLYAEGQGLADDIRADLEGPSYVWPAVAGLPAGVCANERGRGAVPFWDAVRTAGFSGPAGTDGVSGLRGDAGGGRKPAATGKN